MEKQASFHLLLYPCPLALFTAWTECYMVCHGILESLRVVCVRQESINEISSLWTGRNHRNKMSREFSFICRDDRRCCIVMSSFQQIGKGLDGGKSHDAIFLILTLLSLPWFPVLHSQLPLLVGLFEGGLYPEFVPRGVIDEEVRGYTDGNQHLYCINSHF